MGARRHSFLTSREKELTELREVREIILASGGDRLATGISPFMGSWPLRILGKGVPSKFKSLIFRFGSPETSRSSE
jgi:hypothetical protein